MWPGRGQATREEPDRRLRIGELVQISHLQGLGSKNAACESGRDVQGQLPVL